MSFLKKFVHDVATLKRPVTASAVAALIVSAFALKTDAEAVSAVLVAVGTIAALFDHQQATKKP